MTTESMPFVHLTLRLKLKCQQYKKFVIVILTLITGIQNNLPNVVSLQVINVYMYAPIRIGPLSDDMRPE